MKTDNGLTVKQSNVITFAKKTFNEEERRIFYQVILQAQDAPPVSDEYIEDPLYNQKISIRIKDILTKGSKDYQGVENAIDNIMSKPITTYFREGRRRILTLFNVADIQPRKGYVDVYINNIVWQMLVNVSRNYSRYDLMIAKSLPSAAAMSIYEIVAYEVIPLTFNIEFLKDILGLADRYPNNGNFVKKVIDASKKYIDRISDRSFDYKTIKKGRKIVAVTLIPVNKNDPNSEKNIITIIKRFGLNAILSRGELYALLACGFNENDITANSALLRRMHDYCRKFTTRLDLFEKLILHLQGIAYKEKGGKKKRQNPKGWIISELSRIIESGEPINDIIPE